MQAIAAFSTLYTLPYPESRWNNASISEKGLHIFTPSKQAADSHNFISRRKHRPS